jgi:inosine-uridine nucleoside N-ribohydrolase
LVISLLEAFNENGTFIKNLGVPDRKIDVILDTDAYNEIDDQYAIAYLLAAKERINPVGITAAPFLNSRSISACDGMIKSYHEILKILDLTGEKKLTKSTFKGSELFLDSEKSPVLSDAAEFIAETAKRYSPENPLYIVAIGAATNVASAYLIAPEAVRNNTVIVWLGGHAASYVNSHEFNLRQDVAAGESFSAAARPCPSALPRVVDIFTTSEFELKHWLSGKNSIADYLVNNTVSEAESYAKGKVWSRCIWDVVAVAWLLNDNDRFMDSYLTPAPVPEYDHYYAQNQKTISCGMSAP